jgi:hypothetical protein
MWHIRLDRQPTVDELRGNRCTLRTADPANLIAVGHRPASEIRGKFDGGAPTCVRPELAAERDSV